MALARIEMQEGPTAEDKRSMVDAVSLSICATRRPGGGLNELHEQMSRDRIRLKAPHGPHGGHNLV
jgi:hypothetical protein